MYCDIWCGFQLTMSIVSDEDYVLLCDVVHSYTSYPTWMGSCACWDHIIVSSLPSYCRSITTIIRIIQFSSFNAAELLDSIFRFCALPRRSSAAIFRLSSISSSPVKWIAMRSASFCESNVRYYFIIISISMFFRMNTSGGRQWTWPWATSIDEITQNTYRSCQNVADWVKNKHVARPYHVLTLVKLAKIGSDFTWFTFTFVLSFGTAKKIHGNVCAWAWAWAFDDCGTKWTENISIHLANGLGRPCPIPLYQLIQTNTHCIAMEKLKNTISIGQQ